jgi:chromosomal replication initiator protein
MQEEGYEISSIPLDLVWLELQQEIKPVVGEANVKAWFSCSSLKTFDENKAVIEVPNVFVSSNLQKKFEKETKKALTKALKKLGLVFNISDDFMFSYEIKKNTEKSKSINQTNFNHPNLSDIKPGIQERKQHSNINPKYTFESFIVGGNNNLAYTVAEAIAKEPGTRFNPLFVYGNVGLGKTHLIQAIGNYIYNQDPSKKIVYVSTDQYITDFLESIRLKTSNFSKIYRDADVLIIDDIQFISGREKTQEEFFHTFNILHQKNKQIIVSADQPPGSIPTLQDRLRSRFQWGMIVDIGAPDFETRSAILQSKANQIGLNIDVDIIEFIAHSIQTNIRELEGAINQIAVLCQLQGIQPDLNLVKGMLNKPRSVIKRFDAKKIIAEVSEFYNISISDIMSPRRDKEISSARQISMYLMRTELKLSLPKISESVGRKDHTTAIHSINKISALILEDYPTKRNIEKIKEKLYE